MKNIELLPFCYGLVIGQFGVVTNRYIFQILILAGYRP